MRTKVSSYFPTALFTSVYDIEKAKVKKRKQNDYFNIIHGAKDSSIQENDLVRIKYFNGKMSQPIKVLRCFRTFSILENNQK